MTYYLGIDTSCYTTSCTLLNARGQIVGEQKKLLTVQTGKRGLRQSEMVFQHTRALPNLIESLGKIGDLAAIGVSAFPRREDNSYMPAFLVGLGQARSLAHCLQVPLYQFSHQENHILSALQEWGRIPENPFWALHISGGTTELLYCHWQPDIQSFSVKIIGQADDLKAGQFIDRVGVALNLPFPAGPHLERLAKTAQDLHALPVAVKRGHMSLGGPYSEAVRRLKRGEEPAILAKAVMECISQSVIKLLALMQPQYPDCKELIAVGGVLSNQALRQCLGQWCQDNQMELHVASPYHSADNALGNAYGAYYCNSQLL